MIESVRDVIRKSLVACSEKERHYWVTNLPGQAVLCTAQVLWTAGITKAIIEGISALKQFYQELAVSSYQLEIEKRNLFSAYLYYSLSKWID